MKHCLGGNRAKLLIQVILGGGVLSNFSFLTFLKKDTRIMESEKRNTYSLWKTWEVHKSRKVEQGKFTPPIERQPRLLLWDLSFQAFCPRNTGFTGSLVCLAPRFAV